MLTENVKQLLNAPKLSETRQGDDTYPRVVRQDKYGDTDQLVTFALPGLQRARVRVTEAEWLQGNHLGIDTALRSSRARLLPPKQHNG